MQPVTESVPAGMPLQEVRADGFLRFETGKDWNQAQDWFRVAAEGEIWAEVAHPPDAFLCRLEPPQGSDVVQLSIGRVRSRLADALFSPAEDLGLKFTGQDLRLEWDDAHNAYCVSARGSLTVYPRQAVYKIGHKLPWYRPLDRSVFQRAPSGWCSWYYYFLEVDEAGVLRNLEWLKDNLAPYGLEYCQVDDGWQGRGTGYGTNRDWDTTCTAKFPHGMQWLAEQIRASGLQPGIWLIPFAHSDARLFQRHPEMFVRDETGGSVNERRAPLDFDWMDGEDGMVEWMGRYLLDPTHPEARAYLEGLFHSLCLEWGYEYVKIDAQGGMAALYEQNRPRLAQPDLSGDLAYRLGLETIKQAMGPGRFLLNCAAGWDSAGLCEGVRIGGDVEASWEGFERAVDCTMRYLYLNGIAWWTDPDVVCVRPPLNLDQARAWATLLGITGQLLMASDDMPALPEERVELLRRIYPSAEIRPMELYPLRNQPGIFNLKVNKPGVGEWDVTAVFNWSRIWSKTGPLTVDALGIPPCKRGFIFYDVWNEQVLAVGGNQVELTIPPMACRLISIRRLEDHPQLIATSRHLTQGAEDLLEASWDPQARSLTGSSQVVAGDPYCLRFTIPEGWQAASQDVEVQAGVGLCVLQADRNQVVEWTIPFR